MKITYTGVGLFWIWLFVNTFTLSAQEKLELSGKIRVLEPVELRSKIWSLSKFWEIVKYREAWCAADHAATKSQTGLTG